MVKKKCGNKKCKCKEPVFRVDHSTPDGYDYECKECQAERSNKCNKRRQSEYDYLNEMIGNYFSRR